MSKHPVDFPLSHVPGGWVGLPDGKIVPASEYYAEAPAPLEASPPAEPSDRPSGKRTK